MIQIKRCLFCIRRAKNHKASREKPGFFRSLHFIIFVLKWLIKIKARV